MGLKLAWNSGMGAKTFLVGIDLGTTNSSLSTISSDSLGETNPTIEDHSPIQVIRPFETAPRPLLPSFLYLSNGNDLPAGSLELPWNIQGGKPATKVIGEFARQQGSLVSSNLVHSAKSWLSNPGADRNEKLLPWPGTEDVPKISPMEASSAYLRHLAESWAFSQKGRTDLSEQTVVLTIPASFDDLARRLTLESAKKAGITNPLLLEEPQAAFYCWMAEQGGKVTLGGGQNILVVDIGGGTTDFSLIETREEDGGIAFSRKAVGDHLLLGGDNMDMAIARVVEGKIKSSTKLSVSQFQNLVQQCRLAKEKLLGETPPEYSTIQIEGRGRSIVGQAMSAEILRAEVLEMVLDGFFPVCTLQDAPQENRRQGAVQLGLPYAQDPAITRHLARFLKLHGLAEKPPDALLLNGGCFHSKELQARVFSFFEMNYPGKPIQALSLGSVDRAVSRGAAYYAWLIQNGKKAIQSSAAKAYYLVLDEGRQDKTKVICVLPRNSTPELEHPVNQHQFMLTLGSPVRFPLFSSTSRMGDHAGTILEIEKGQMHSLPALQTVLTGGRKSGLKTTTVHMVSKLSAIGTLDLHLVDENANRWHLDFNLQQEVTSAPESSPLPPTGYSVPDHLVSEAIEKIQGTFPPESMPSSNSPGELPKDLEKILESGRENWSAAICRRLWVPLQQGADSRRLTQAHLARWYNLSGWVLRPGFGHPQDSHFVEQIWKALHAPPKGQNGIRQPEGGPELWILLRRIAGGLASGKQLQIIERLKPFLIPGKSRAPFKPPLAEIMEMWRCAASLERVGLPFRQNLADALHRKILQNPIEATDWQIWSLGKLGARIPTHGTIAAVLPKESAGDWIKTLLSVSPKSETASRNLGSALVQMGMATNHPDLDVPQDLRLEITAKLRTLECPEMMADILQGKKIDNSHQIAEATFGESIPLGLHLIPG